MICSLIGACCVFSFNMWIILCGRKQGGAGSAKALPDPKRRLGSRQGIGLALVDGGVLAVAERSGRSYTLYDCTTAANRKRYRSIRSPVHLELNWCGRRSSEWLVSFLSLRSAQLRPSEARAAHTHLAKNGAVVISRSLLFNGGLYFA